MICGGDDGASGLRHGLGLSKGSRQRGVAVVSWDSRWTGLGLEDSDGSGDSKLVWWHSLICGSGSVEGGVVSLVYEIKRLKLIGLG
ncbi:hypothetical protein M0R45_002656 [Rubus argutus]|uniref:Uncharacterized protein n=1 Tax=Rubus argutus TaxID=59490 RepID=A0AAW1VP85_RUBAR